MTIRINTDVSWGHLNDLAQAVKSGGAESYGAFPRKTVYGSAPNLVPLGDFPDLIVSEKDIKETIEYCHANKLFPMYYEETTWAKGNKKWNQNGLNYCWMWSITADVMSLEGIEGKRDSSTPLLAPISGGRFVNWKNAGNYLEDVIQKVTEFGIASETFVKDEHTNKKSNMLAGWEEDALLHRIPEGAVWDTDPNEMLRHCLTILSKGRSIYGGWHNLGHAMTVVGMKWDTSVYDNVVWIVRNSHNEDKPIEMTGRQAAPDEGYGIQSTLNV